MGIVRCPYCRGANVACLACRGTGRVNMLGMEEPVDHDPDERPEDIRGYPVEDDE